jgi:hypothetical protein
VEVVPGHVIHSEQPTTCNYLNKVLGKEKTAVKFETKLFKNKINGIVLGDMTRPTV